MSYTKVGNLTKRADMSINTQTDKFHAHHHQSRREMREDGSAERSVRTSICFRAEGNVNYESTVHDQMFHIR